MYILSIEGVGWRNYDSLGVSWAPGLNLVLGPNGAGKTNLLEAVAFLADLVSFRTRGISDLVRWGAEGLRISGRVQDGSPRTLAVEAAAGRRRLFVDGLPCRSLSGYLGILETLVIPADSVRLVFGSPEVRRRSIDRAVVRAEPGRAELLTSYRRALRARNKLLKEGRRSEARAYDAPLASLGATLTRHRLTFLQQIRRHFERIWAVVSGSSMGVSIRYAVRGWQPEELQDEVQEAWVAKFRAALDDSLEVDFRLGRTTIGPHVDDVVFEVQGRRASNHVSQGQARALAVSYVLAEWHALAELGKRPVILLDELSGQFDAERQAAILQLLGDMGCQALVTSADESLASKGAWSRVVHVPAGSVTLHRYS